MESWQNWTPYLRTGKKQKGIGYCYEFKHKPYHNNKPWNHSPQAIMNRKTYKTALFSK